MLSLFLSLFLLLFFPSFQSRYLQTWSPSCATCSSPPSEYLSNCDSCAPNYAAIKDNTSQCLLITGTYEHYYYNHITNLFEECYSNCKTCSGRPDMGACITCIDNNYKKFETDMVFWYANASSRVLPHRSHFPFMLSILFNLHRTRNKNKSQLIITMTIII